MTPWWRGMGAGSACLPSSESGSPLPERSASRCWDRNARLVTNVVVFNAQGLPLDWMVLIIIVDWPHDHLRTVVPISRDLTGGDMNTGNTMAEGI